MQGDLQIYEGINKHSKIIIRMVFWLLLAIIVGGTLETLAYMIPTDRIRENISRGVGIYNVEINFYEYAEGYRITMNDNDSDSVILCETAYSSGSPLKDAMLSLYPDNGTGVRVNNILAFANFHDDEYSMVEYSRYWHGYVTNLKPLYYFFDFSDIRVIKYIVEIALYMYLGLLLTQKLKYGNEYLIGYYGLLIMINPIIIALAYQYIPCVYIPIITSIVLLKRDILAEKKSLLPYVFLINGISTSYFDFLPFPILSLGLPLALTLLCDVRIWDKIKNMISYSLCWSLGYLGMWFGKCLLSSIVLHENVFKIALQYILHRTGQDAPDTTKLQAFL